jgi:YD repeat-containing protein
MRRALALFATVLIGLSIAVWIQIWAGPWSGPLASGALFWQWRKSETPVSHQFVADFQLLHKGHVDVGTGLYVREDQDLALRHAPPFIFTRTYLSGYRVSRQFGIGTTNNAEWYLIGDPVTFAWAELILPSGVRIRFDRTTDGTSYDNAAFVHRSAPSGQFYGSALGWVGSHWLMRFRDGSLARFLACGSPTSSCSLIQLRDPDGHVLDFQRDEAGVLRAIQAPAERIALQYDDRRRITEARDDDGHRVQYAYDEHGRLVQVRDDDGNTRTYTYSEKDELLTIREPGWLITNTFDENGRVTRQTTLLTSSTGDPGQESTIEFDYKLFNDLVTETTVKEYDGSYTVHRFDADRYRSMEIRDARGPQPITIVYTRHAVGHYTTTIKVYCTVNGRRVNGSTPVAGDEWQAKRDLIQQTCATSLPTDPS